MNWKTVKAMVALAGLVVGATRVATAQDPAEILSAGAVAQQTVRRGSGRTNNLFTFEVLEALVKSAGLRASRLVDREETQSLTLTERLNGENFRVVVSLHKAGPAENERVMVVLSMGLGIPRRETSMAAALRVKLPRGLEARDQGGVLYLTRFSEAEDFTVTRESVLAAKAKVKAAADAEADEAVKSQLQAQADQLENFARRDLVLRLKPEVLRERYDEMIATVVRYSEIFDRDQWKRLEDQTTVGKPEIGQFVNRGRLHDDALRHDYPTREGSRYHQLYEFQRRPDYLNPTGSFYDRTVGQTEKFRSRVPINLPFVIERNPENASQTERGGLYAWQRGTELLNQTGPLYDQYYANGSRFRGRLPAAELKHFRFDLDYNRPAAPFYRDDLIREYNRYYTGTGGDLRTGRFYDGFQPRPIWMGH